MALELNPDDGFARAEYGIATVYTGSILEGTAEIEKAVQAVPKVISARWRLALAYGLAGRMGEAEDMLREAEEAMSRMYIPGTVIAMMHVFLGEKDRAFEALNRTVREGTSTMDVLYEPLFDSLRTVPRFHQILEKIGLS